MELSLESASYKSCVIIPDTGNPQEALIRQLHGQQLLYTRDELYIFIPSIEQFVMIYPYRPYLTLSIRNILPRSAIDFPTAHR